MNRTLYLTLLISFLLVGTYSYAAAPQPKPGSKAGYSVRPYNYQVVRPYYGTPVKPRFAAPVVPQEPKLAPAPIPPTEQPEPVDAVVADPPMAIVPPAPITTEKIIVVRDALPEISVENEVDALNARLAKIQLERHNLSETLKLIAKIKSETFKVKTLVDLAEYVSRDRNYSFEALHIYSLAIKGIAALNQDEAFEFETNITVPPPPAPKPENVVKVKPVPEPEPVPEPAPEPEPVAEPEPAIEKSKPAKTPVLVDEEASPPKDDTDKEDAEPADTAPAGKPEPAEVPPPPKAPTSVDAYENTKPVDPAPVRKPKPGIVLEDEPEKTSPAPAPTFAPPAPEVKKEEPKPLTDEEPKPAPKPVRKPIPGKKITLEEN